MRVTKENTLRVKAATGHRLMEVLKITRSGIDARDIRKAGRDVLSTGYTFFGMVKFWELVKSGQIEIV